jgi:hypothetical protein
VFLKVQLSCPSYQRDFEDIITTAIILLDVSKPSKNKFIMATSEIHALSRIADFMVGDSDLWITNRFEKLHLMNLLYAQRRLTRLEEEVNDHVLYDQHLTGYAPHPNPTRPSEAIFADLQTAIVGYST